MSLMIIPSKFFLQKEFYLLKNLLL